jgi:hypothetical protein
MGRAREKSGMKSGYTADASVAMLLATVPAFQQWGNQPLDPKIHSILNNADEQTLLTIAVYALRRVTEEPHA